MFVVWAPYLRSDSKAAAQRAASYVSDPRVHHYWDLWQFGSKTYAKEFNYPQYDAWDLFVGYQPGSTWHEKSPEPTFYLQNRNLDHGVPYSKQALEDELKKLTTE